MTLTLKNDVHPLSSTTKRKSSSCPSLSISCAKIWYWQRGAKSVIKYELGSIVPLARGLHERTYYKLVVSHEMQEPHFGQFNSTNLSPILLRPPHELHLTFHLLKTLPYHPLSLLTNTTFKPQASCHYNYIYNPLTLTTKPNNPLQLLSFFFSFS